MIKYYYVQLNENSIGAYVISSPKKLNVANMVLIPDYNETYIGRHWDGNQWSEERYDSTIEVELQQKVTELEITTEELVTKNNELLSGIHIIQSQNEMFEGMLMEMMEVMTTLSGGVE